MPESVLAWSSTKASRLTPSAELTTKNHILVHRSAENCGSDHQLTLSLTSTRLPPPTSRHGTVQDLLETLLVKQGHNVTVNKVNPGQRLRPDVEFILSGSRDSSPGYRVPWIMEPQERGSNIRLILGIDARSWGAFRFKARLAAIQGSLEIVCSHFHYGAPNPEDEEIPLLHVETTFPPYFNTI
ncbi:hypothetical protein OUZ56_018733 [Daphnia magna]|uniref:Uncharacterized protein n=1 Tax=Daphnia magna TaxID=35525 RepID=A0ABQ9Z9L3_9CRUS|nr:hypothetical protein OUZ56_018733 [Daphnia magna]